MDKILILAVILLVSGAFLFSGTAKTVRVGVETESWPAVSGNMQFSQILQRGSVEEGTDEALYYPDVRYFYVVDGTRYEGTKLFAYDYFTPNKELLEDILSNFRNSSIIDVFYDKENPERSVLLQGSSESEDVGKFNVGSILMIAGGMLFFYQSMKKGIF
ncbi:MAG: DUF3592 domain-containing protein [Candidatus Omnitrophica bacterium]|nr:DUF3592 domain-containing protein [Candidatus Omnitrophota bacterium]MBU1996836.1 DUF3592 domain-containing protein [Candidatus Omnitrophota bacterium]MBU4332971.1 DUF3592 domain-containing protein [Candidatus Omnitrophota bacterium]